MWLKTAFLERNQPKITLCPISVRVMVKGNEHVAPAARTLNQMGKKPRKDRLENGETAAFAGQIPQTVTKWVETIERGKGVADPALRVAVMNRVANWSGGRPRERLPVPEPIAEFTDTIARNAVEVTDGHIMGMKGAGYSELEIFEFTFAASTGAGLARLEIAWDAIAEATERVT